MSLALVVLAVLAAAAGLSYVALLRQESHGDRILGLLYHRIVTEEQYACCPPTEKIFSISDRRFREQLEHLRASGYHAVTLDAVMDYLRTAKQLPPKPVLITFDDGCVSVYDHALPIMRELEMPGLLFVTTDPQAWVFKLGSNAQRRITDEEMRDLDAGGIAIGSHAVTHEPLEAMTLQEIGFELGESKRFLESVLGHPVRYFGVPLNWYGPKVKAVARECGYEAVCTSDNGTIHAGSDPFHLKRFIIEGSFTLDEFTRNLGAHAIAQRRIINAIKRFPARLLGPRIWLPLRRRLFGSFLGRFFTLRRLKRLLATGAVLTVIAVLALIWWVTTPR